MAALPVEISRRCYADAPAGQCENRHGLHELNRDTECADWPVAGVLFAAVHVAIHGWQRDFARPREPVPHDLPGTAVRCYKYASPTGFGLLNPCSSAHSGVAANPELIDSIASEISAQAGGHTCSGGL